MVIASSYGLIGPLPTVEVRPGARGGDRLCASVQHAWVDDTVKALRQEDVGAYVNVMADEGSDGLRAACPQPTLDRLREIKRRYDPGNLFHLNQNIIP